jgi:two-component system response regulator FixJ
MAVDQVTIAPTKIAYIIDDDRDVRIAMSLLLRTAGWGSRPFGSADDFLAELPDLQLGCLLVDIRMPGKDGITLLRELRASGRDDWPAIVMTGHADIPAAVQAMKLGALEFLEKPFSEGDLLDSLERGFASISGSHHKRRQQEAARSKLERLNEREASVLALLREGKSNKEIALELSLSPRTVEAHRANLMRKLDVGSLAEMLELAMVAGDQALPVPSSNA